MRACLLSLWLLSCGAVNAQTVPIDPGKQLQVVIISVENFDAPEYQNPLLQLNIQKATDDLIKFFSMRFSEAHITVLRTREDTTSAHLTEFFKGTFPGIVNGNMTLLFVLSHGEALPLPNPAFGSDLRIVASDTAVNNIPGKTISLSTDVLGNIGGLLPGSFLFGFVDTCHGGAAANIGLSIDTALKNALGVKTMLMASSLSDQLGFQASFSEALVRIWNPPANSAQKTTSSACTVPEVSLNRIRDQIQDILGTSVTLGPNEGYPTVLIHFQGTMCLETFAAQSAIVDIINGTPDSYVASFTDADGLKFDQPISAHDAVPIRLSRTMYELAIYRNNEQVTKAKQLDMTMGTFDWEVLGAPDSHQLGSALEQGAIVAASVGADPLDVQSARRLSYSAYMIAHDLPNADRIAQSSESKSDFAWKPDQVLAFRSIESRNALIKTAHPDDLGAAADQLQRHGDLETAGDLFAAAAAKAKEENSGPSSYFATEAYLSFSAAGKYDKAKSTRQLYKVPVQTFCSQCKQLEVEAIKGNLPYAQVLGNLGTVQVLANISAADMQAKVDSQGGTEDLPHKPSRKFAAIK